MPAALAKERGAIKWNERQSRRMEENHPQRKASAQIGAFFRKPKNQVHHSWPLSRALSAGSGLMVEIAATQRLMAMLWSGHNFGPTM